MMKKLLSLIVLLSMSYSSSSMAASSSGNQIAFEFGQPRCLFSGLKACAPVTLAAGLSLEVQIKNTSAINVSNILAYLPSTGTPWSQIVITYSGCGTVLPQGICTITFDGTNITSSANPSTVTILGEGTNTLTFLLGISG